MNVVTLKNNTPLPVEVSMYVGFESTGRGSVIWRQTYLPPNGPGVLQWDDSLSVCLADIADNVFTPFITKPAEAGSRWTANTRDGVLTLEEDGRAPVPSHIVVRNQSGVFVNPGVGVGGEAAFYYRDVLSNTAAQFDINALRYFIAATALAKPGHTVAGTTMLSDPVPIDFPPLLPAALVLVAAQGTGFRLTVQYGGIGAPTAG
jgi:hypothetical protein